MKFLFRPRNCILVVVIIFLAFIVKCQFAETDVENIQLIHPSATSVTHVVPGDTLVLKGDSSKRCQAYQGNLKFNDSSDQFQLTHQLPAQIHGERLLWVEFRCPDESSARFARTIVPSKAEDTNSLQKNVEVVEATINFNGVNQWIQKELKNFAQNELVSLLEYTGKDYSGNDCEKLTQTKKKGDSPTFDPKCAIEVPTASLHFRVLAIALTKFKITTSEAIMFDVSADLLLWERKIECDFPCNENKESEATVGWKFRVDPTAPETPHQNLPFKLKITTEKFSLKFKNNPLRNFMVVSSKESISNKFEEELESHIESQIERIFHQFRRKTFTELWTIQFEDHTTDERTKFSLILSDSGTEQFRLNADLHGGRLTLSLSVSNDWLGTSTLPEHDLVNNHNNTDVSATISYVFINRILKGIMEDLNLDEILKKLRYFAHKFGKSNEFDNTVQRLVDFTGFLNKVNWLDGIEFNDSLNFQLPLRLRPVSVQESRVFFSQAEAFSTNSWLDWNSEPTPVGFSMEGEFELGRFPESQHVDFLLDHIAIEPLSSTDQSDIDSDKSNYELSPLIHGFLVSKLKSGIQSISNRSYLPIEIELPTSRIDLDSRKNVLSIDLLENDIDQNSLVVRGRIGHSRNETTYINSDY